MSTISNSTIQQSPEKFFYDNDFGFFKRFSDKDPHFSVSSRIAPYNYVKDDYGRALSFEVYDPLWMLTRQWQYGRFKGNDCGSIVTAKIKMVKLPLQYLELTGADNAIREYSSASPLEYEVEKRDRRITPYVRISSAAHLLKKLNRLKDDNAIRLIDYLRSNYELYDFTSLKIDSLEAIRMEQNIELKRLYAVYGSRLFDGYWVILDWQSGALKEGLAKEKLDLDSYLAILDDYHKWFMEKYAPLSKGMGGEPNESPSWNEEKLGYELTAGVLNDCYIAEDYDSGKLSWYSFDGKSIDPDLALGKRDKYKESNEKYDSQLACDDEEAVRMEQLGSFDRSRFSGKKPTILSTVVGGDLITGKKEDTPKVTEWRKEYEQIRESHTKMLTYLPVTADFPDAPAHRLWEMEGRGVAFGNQKDVSMLANSLVMQYTSMYSHDWMITPLEVETGCIVDVDGIVLTDTFGERILINESAEENDNLSKKTRFDDRWSLFGMSKQEAWKNSDFEPFNSALFIPPTIQRTEESRPLEEVQFLRDEMANMLWGVETIIDNECGGTWNGKEMSNAVLAVVDERNKKSEELSIDGCDYSYLLQNRVPLHWIPFIPRHIKGQAREIRLQRGIMPVFLEDRYEEVRPSTSLLQTKRDRRGWVIPRFINEEEISGYGVKLVNTAQRARWFLGKTFNWTGLHTVIDGIQANSGLMFDELIDKETKKRITTTRKQ